MKLIIDIPEKTFKYYVTLANKGEQIGSLERIILDGTPIPKKHGRIGDLDSMMNDISNSINEMTNIGISVDGQYLWAKLNDAIDNASIIINAEGSDSE